MMRLLIIVPDKTVCKDNLCISNLVLQGIPTNVRALQWYEDHGEIELKNGMPNEIISELPNWANDAVAAWDVKHAEITKPAEVLHIENNKQTAISLLYDTDWATIPDVSDPLKSSPYLTNVQDFLTFRNAVRAVVINPPETQFNFPPTPKAQWSNK